MKLAGFSISLVLLAVLVGFPTSSATPADREKHKNAKRIPRQRRNRSEKPNIVFILTDDQDLLLGLYSVQYLYSDYTVFVYSVQCTYNVCTVIIQ